MNKKKWKIPRFDEYEPNSDKYGIVSYTKKLSTEEQIIKYFECLLGDKLTITNVLKDNKLQDFCDYNKLDKDFVINVIKNYLYDHPNNAFEYKF